MRIFLLITTVTFAFMMSGCTMFNKKLVNSSNLQAGSRAHGEALYAANCASCHNELANSTKKNKTADDIALAISTQGQMRFLSFLQRSDLEDIAVALSPPDNPPPPPAQGAQGIEARVGNRYLVYSNFRELFVADSGQDGSDQAILQVLQANVMEHVESFGGGCTRYDEGCMPKICGLKGSDACEAEVLLKHNSTPTPTGNVLRMGYTTRTCEEVLSIDKSVTTVLGKAEVNGNAAPTATSITAVMNFVYMNKPMSQAAIDASVKLAQTAQGKGMSVLDQWRFVLLPICMSSAADLL